MECFVFAMLFHMVCSACWKPVCVCYFWLMTVLGFRGLLDSESYMPTGVSQKAVDLIGCIRGCVSVCASLCVHLCVCVCLCVCELNYIWSENDVFCRCAKEHVCAFTSVCIFFCVFLTFSWLKVLRLTLRHSVDSIFFIYPPYLTKLC